MARNSVNGGLPPLGVRSLHLYLSPVADTRARGKVINSHVDPQCLLFIMP